MKKKMITLLFAGTLALAVSACGAKKEQTGASQTKESTKAQQGGAKQEETLSSAESQPENETAQNSDQSVQDKLVVYFTYAENAALPEGVDASTSASIQIWNEEMTGNTGAIAHVISETTGADLFSIQTVEKYPDSYDATIDQAQKERRSGIRPELATHIENLDNYSTIFLGYPNWWSDMPMAVYSFLDEYDLSGKTIVPFVTSGGSGFSGTISEIQSAEPSATVVEGLSLSDSDAMRAQDEIQNWLTGLGY